VVNFAGTPTPREHRAGLDRDVEDLALLVVEAEEVAARIRWPVLEIGRNS